MMASELEFLKVFTTVALRVLPDEVLVMVFVVELSCPEKFDAFLAERLATELVPLIVSPTENLSSGVPGRKKSIGCELPQL
jgi:hypothetical protein